MWMWSHSFPGIIDTYNMTNICIRLTLQIEITPNILILHASRLLVARQNFHGKVVMTSGICSHNSGENCQPILRS